MKLVASRCEVFYNCFLLKDMASGDLNSCLNNFYDKIASSSVAMHRSLFQLRSIAHKIIKMVEEKDARFRGLLTDVGSLDAEVYTMHVDECDILLVLKIDGNWMEDSRYPNYARFRTPDRRWRDCTTDECLLLPRKVADLFFGYVDEIVKSCKFDNIEVRVSGLGTVATTLTVDSSDMTEWIPINVDIVVAIKCHGWPDQACAPWLQADSNRGWPKHDKVGQIKEEGFQLVAKSHGGGEATETLWRLSFATAESCLLKGIDSKDRKDVLCHRKLLVILKCIRKLALSGLPGTTPIISSYMLKTLLYHQCCLYPEPQNWTEEKLGERFSTAIEAFYESIRQEVLPHFFVPATNLFEHRGVRFMEKRFQVIKDDPCGFLKKLESVTRKTDFYYGSFGSPFV